jgi:putative zinc finger protein
MDHRQYIEQYLSADIDGELSPAERQAVADHLSSCAACRQRQGEERAFKDFLHQRIPIGPAPPELRQKIIALLDREDAGTALGRKRLTRRWLLTGTIGALAAAAVIAVVMVGGLGRQHNQALDAVANDYLSAERSFASNSAISTQAGLATALTSEFGYPFIWDFSSIGLTLAGARIEHRPDGAAVVYSLYKGKGQSILCINVRQPDFVFPPGGKETHGVRFYRYRDLWIGVVNYGSVFCYFVTRLSPAQMLPALIHGNPLPAA